MIKKLIKAILLFAVFAVCFMIPGVAQAKDKDGNLVVVIDAGHGGIDGGATQNGVVESTCNYNTALGLKAQLETYNGVRVYITRGSAEWFSNTGRGRFGNMLGADLFVCLHYNSGSATATGIEVYSTVNPSFRDQMTRLSKLIINNVTKLGFKSRGVMYRSDTKDPTMDYFTALDEASKCGIPSVLVEHCFLSNPSDAAFMSVVENQYRMGAADADGIAEYFGLSKRMVDTNSSLTLIRTYSAQIKGDLKSCSSSDTNVAFVSDSGLITAVGSGSAKISCTDNNGRVSEITITVPEVVQVGVAAGISPTFYNNESAARAYNKSTVITKAIYSDGSAIQVNGILGEPKVLTAERGHPALDIPVSYGGYTNNLRVYCYSFMNVTVNPKQHLPVGNNRDVLLIPGSFQTPVSGTVKPTEPPTEPQTEPPTVQPATEAPSTEAPVVTQAPDTTSEATEADTTESVEAVSETVTQQTLTETATQTKEDNNTGSKKNGIKIIKIIIIALIGVCVAASIGCVIYLKKR